MKRSNQSTNARVVIRDSKNLTNIDGFVVTDGDRSRITVSTRLNKEERDQGINHLKSLSDTKSPGIYLWNAND